MAFIPGFVITTWLPTCPTTFQPNFLNVLTACLPEIFASLVIFLFYTETTMASCFEYAGIFSRAFWSSAHNQAVIASFILSRASFSSLPWETHPGREGHSTTIQPSSASSNTTWNKMLYLQVTLIFLSSGINLILLH